MPFVLKEKEKKEIADIQSWLNKTRFSRYKRDYDAIEVWKLRSKYQS